MTAPDRFNDLVKQIAPLLKQAGFSRQAATFRRKQGENYGIVWFQKSRGNTKACARFTIELAVFSRLLHEADPHWAVAVPNAADCQWRQRLPFLLHFARDHWWTIDDSTSVDSLSAEIHDALKRVGIPLLLARTSDEQLVDAWRGSHDGGTNDVSRLSHLAVLLHALGPAEEFGEIVKQLRVEGDRDVPWAPSVRDLLSRLGA